MFHHVSGVLIAKTPGEAVLEAGGVGYQLRIPASTYQVLPLPSRPATLLAYLHVTGDSLTLYGFATLAERELFLQLIQHVSGVGPKLALAVLSRGRVEHLRQAIRLGDFASLKGGGVGEGTAKRIILELGKILIKHSAAAAQATGRGGVEEGVEEAAAPALPNAFPSISGLDEMTDLAVKAVAQLNEVPSDVALRAVQRAFDELRAANRTPGAVQDLIQRALPYTQ